MTEISFAKVLETIDKFGNVKLIAISSLSRDEVYVSYELYSTIMETINKQTGSNQTGD